MTTNPKKYDFTGKVALVTGSSSGIGAAIAMQFAQYGAKVTIHGRNVDALDEVAKKIHEATGHQPLKVVGDFMDQSLPPKLIDETIAKFGKLDILVNNAGGASPNESLDNPDIMENYDKVFGLNVRCVVHLTSLAHPHLEKTQGNIINISSIAGIRPYGLIYSPSKAALDMFTKASAAELGLKGIRVNSINPGPVMTAFMRSMGLSASMEGMKDNIAPMTTLNRVPGPEEIANLASFLASSDAANITGSIIVSDTGVLVKKAMPNLTEKK